MRDTHDLCIQRPFEIELPGGVTVIGHFVAELGRIISLTFDDGVCAEVGAWGQRVDFIADAPAKDRPWLMALSAQVLERINDAHRWDIADTNRIEPPMTPNYSL